LDPLGEQKRRSEKRKISLEEMERIQPENGRKRRILNWLEDFFLILQFKESGILRYF